MVQPRGLALASLAAWLVWRKAVLNGAKQKTDEWGPQWLAQLISGTLIRFGSWWLNFTHNAEEGIKAGLWDADKQYVMAWHPHGAFTIAALYFISNFWARGYPGGQRRFVCVAPLLLNVPGLAEFLLLCHARSQDSETFSSLLATGAIVAVQPGGLREQVETDEKRERVFFGKNLGFIRLALKHGTPLLPVYAFGENQLFPTSDMMRRINMWLYRNLGTGNLVVHGLGGSPNTPILPNPLLLPTPGRGLHIRWGEPVEVGPPDAEPSEEKVRHVFELYIGALCRLFDTYKDTCLPKEVADRGLEVFWNGERIDGRSGPGGGQSLAPSFARSRM